MYTYVDIYIYMYMYIYTHIRTSSTWLEQQMNRYQSDAQVTTFSISIHATA